MMADLRLAVRRGLVVLDVPDLGTVTLTGRILRYDPALTPQDRARAVLAILRAL